VEPYCRYRLQYDPLGRWLELYKNKRETFGFMHPYAEAFVLVPIAPFRLDT